MAGEVVVSACRVPEALCVAKHQRLVLAPPQALPSLVYNVLVCVSVYAKEVNEINKLAA